jgi:hypothetical protein
MTAGNICREDPHDEPRMSDCQFPTSQMDISRIILATYGGHPRDNPTDVGMRLKPEDPSDVGSLEGYNNIYLAEALALR